MWVASGLLICTILAAVLVAVQEQEKNAADHATEENLISDGAVVNSSPTALSDLRTVNEESANSEMSSGETISIDHTDTVFSRAKFFSADTIPSAESESCFRLDFRNISARNAGGR
jgi:hypothetical protein